METNRIKKAIAFLLVVLFLLTVTAGAASAGGWGGWGGWDKGVDGCVSLEYQTYNMHMHDGLGDGLRIDSSKNTQLNTKLQKGPVLLKW